MVKHCHLTKHSGYQPSEQAALGRGSRPCRGRACTAEGTLERVSRNEDLDNVPHIGSHARSKYDSDSKGGSM